MLPLLDISRAFICGGFLTGLQYVLPTTDILQYRYSTMFAKQAGRYLASEYGYP